MGEETAGITAPEDEAFSTGHFGNQIIKALSGESQSQAWTGHCLPLGNKGWSSAQLPLAEAPWLITDGLLGSQHAGDVYREAGLLMLG